MLPTISEIDLTGSQALPDLHLDVHVYATKPAERFVYINMRKYQEGATLAEGPVLERIRRDGVVLELSAACDSYCRASSKPLFVYHGA